MTTIKYREAGAWKTLGQDGAAGTDGLGVPSGGAAGYLLQHPSATANDAAWFRQPGVRVRRAATLAIGAGGFVNIPWETADYETDAGGMWVPPSGQRIYCGPGRAGYYQARASVAVGYVASNRIALRVMSWDGVVLAEKAMAVSTSHCSVDISTTVPLDGATSATNVYFVVYSQVASSVLANNFYNWAELRWVAPL